MGIGGANPQNVGRLTRNMQQPILVSAPPQDARLRHALSIYHKGLTFDFSADTALTGMRRSVTASIVMN